MTNRLKITTVLLLILCVLLLTGCTSATEKNYRAAVELLDAGEFGKAAEMLEALGSYEDASMLLMYSRAALAAENGDYLSAFNALFALGEFRDAPEMLRYYESREVEASGLEALAAEDYDAAVRSLTDAARRYGELSEFRDAPQRGEDCLAALYDCAGVLLAEARYAPARDVFTALDGYMDSRSRLTYCEAGLLEEDGAYLEAAARFLEIPDLLDAAERADRDRDLIYRQALDLSAQGNPEGAISLFAKLGTYRDAEDQRINMIRQLMADRLQRGDCEGALLALDTAADAITLQQVTGPEERQRIASFLDGFVQSYLLFSSGAVDSAYAYYYGVAPYIEQGSPLDRRFRQVLTIGTYGHNNSFNYYGSELLDLVRLDADFCLAYVRASASVNQPIGPVQVTRTFRIVVRDSESGLCAGSIEDCLYGDSDQNERPVITGPLPNGELPPDEDGDGIILVDVRKKGFQGIMMIVLDPSRVFAGGPGFYGGNGMLLEDLVKRYDALGGINGGGFIDEDGGGSGGLPEGLTIVDGKTYDWRGSGVSAAFDENDVLHVEYYTAESAAAAGIRDCVSFGPALIVDGEPEFGRHMESGINPRTAIGQREDGAVLMLCIDGRQIHSIGASYGDLRDVMLDFGAVNACSLDGGSSTVMYLYGEYLNSPSSASGTSRFLPNAFLISK